MGLANGMFNAETGNPAELNMRSFAGTVLRLFPNGSAPMFALTAKSGRSRAKSTTHGYFSKVMTFITVTMATTALSTDDTITVPSTTGMIPGMILFNTRTKENIRIIGINSGTEIAVTRGFGRVSAAGVNNADKWLHVGTAYEQGSFRPVARRLTTTHIPNYTQIFRNAWAITDTARASYAEAGISNIAENRKDCMMFHAVDIEGAIVWGQPKMDTTGATPVHATQGVLDAIEQYCPQNSNPAGATTNYSELVTLVEPAFQYSTDLSDPKTRIGFGDSQAIKVLNDIGRKSGQVNIMQSENEFGMKFTQFTFYKGTINLVEHPLFNGLGQAGMLLVMDMAALKLAYLDGRDTRSEEYGAGGKAPDNGQDAQGGSLTTEAAVELINPYSCCVVTGLTAGVMEPILTDEVAP